MFGAVWFWCIIGRFNIVTRENPHMIHQWDESEPVSPTSPKKEHMWQASIHIRATLERSGSSVSGDGSVEP